MKYLLLLAGAILVYFLVRNALRRRNIAQRGESASPEDMVRCVVCGVHMPRGESLTARGQTYCCDEHQRQHGPDA
jgi:uncharacterized protein